MQLHAVQANARMGPLAIQTRVHRAPVVWTPVLSIAKYISVADGYASISLWRIAKRMSPARLWMFNFRIRLYL